MPLQLAEANVQLDRFGQRFWSVTRFILDGGVRSNDDVLAFNLDRSPRDGIPTGRHHLISKSHPLGEHVVGGAKALETHPARIVFDVTHHPTRVHVIESLERRLAQPPETEALFTICRAVE